MLYKAKLEYVFNKPENSNILINKILDKYKIYFNDSIIADLFEMRAANAFRLQDYESAYSDLNLIVNKYGQLYDSATVEGHKEDIIVRHALIGIPEMVIEKDESKDVKLNSERDLAGLLNIPVTTYKVHARLTKLWSSVLTTFFPTG